MYYILLQAFLTESLPVEQTIPVERYGLALASIQISAVLVLPFSWHVQHFEIIWSFLLLQDL